MRIKQSPKQPLIFLQLALSCILLVCSTVYAESSATQPEDERWESIRMQLFGEKAISEEPAVISLIAPGRAFDGARVPVTMRALVSQTEEEHIEKLYLIVDNNPVPVAATFDFQTGKQWSTLDTELRVNEYSFVRAVAQMNDGGLFMSSSFVKAVGGCSAPPSSYERSDASLLGTFSGGVEQLFNPKVPAVARIRITHPNASGMQFDQFSRTYIPAHYIHTMHAIFNDKPLFTLETNFSMSQDPVLGFNFHPDESGKLTLSAIDSENRIFEQSWDISGQ